MMIFLVILFFSVNIVCQVHAAVQYEDIGCFNDKIKDRALPDLLYNYRNRGEIDWKNDWPKLSRVIDGCAKLTKEKGYLYFGIQFYGECWSGSNGAKTFYKHGKSRRCVHGVGRSCANRVYMLTGPGREQCSKSKYHTLGEGDRSSSFKGDGDKCDHPLPHGHGWYRFTGNAGNVMATSSVSKFSCNTIMPGWMTGKLPEIEDQTVDRRVCFVSDESWEKDDCKHDITIQVKNCGHFFVYKLQKAPRCLLRYCGAFNHSLPVGF